MRISVVTIFPQMFERVFEFGMVRQARQRGHLEVEAIDLRNYASDRHRTVDDRPFGGGDGMVLKPQPLFDAVEDLGRNGPQPCRTVLLSPQGRKFRQSIAVEYSLLPHLVLLCGRYEGVDQRVAENLVDEELSIGDFVLSGGEFASMLIVDAISRLIPGVVSKSGSVLQESFMDGMLDCSHYTRPAEFRGLRVPEVLLSGDHAAVERWRRRDALRKTQRLRPDLLESDEEALASMPTSGGE